MTPSTSVASPLAWERAFALAAAHGHLWAQSFVDDELVALHSALVAADAAAASAPAWYDTAEEAFAPTRARRDAAAAFDAAVRARREEERVGRAPRSLAEACCAEAAACVDNAFPCGIGPSLSHTTGTGRLRWLVHESGAVALAVSRPEGDVIHCDVTADGRVVAYHTGRFAWRHVEALRQALAALGLEVPMTVATFAEDDWSAFAAGCEARAAEADALAATYPDAHAAFHFDAARARRRAEAWRTWARVRRPILRGGTSAAYEAAAPEIARGQRAALAMLFG